MKVQHSIFTICLAVMVFSGSILAKGTSENPSQVEVLNFPATQNVSVTGTPSVVVSNTQANPLPVSVVSGIGVNPNPGLPMTPVFAFKNAENGGSPILFGPLDAQAKIAIGSITFDGGDDTWGTQVWLSITDCNSPPSTLDLGPAYMVRNRAAGLGPQHMTFPIPMIIPFENPGQDWCFQAFPTTQDQTLITVVGYLIE